MINGGISSSFSRPDSQLVPLFFDQCMTVCSQCLSSESGSFQISLKYLYSSLLVWMSACPLRTGQWTSVTPLNPDDDQSKLILLCSQYHEILIRVPVTVQKIEDLLWTLILLTIGLGGWGSWKGKNSFTFSNLYLKVFLKALDMLYLSLIVTAFW